MTNNIAISIKGLKKQYKLGQIGGGTLQGDLQSWWARMRHQEDPNTKLGQEEQIKGSSLMALNGIDLEIKRGEAVGIIGHNGAGKSTLLKILSRVTAPSEGSIDIYGRVASMLEVGTGFNGEMTGRENIYMNGAILGMTKAEVTSKLEQIIDFSECGPFIDTPVKRYSSGMYVKLAFSVAAHLDSEILIMDEVLAVGDMKFQKKCLGRMGDASSREGRTVLYVSHNMGTIRQFCNRCVVMKEGRIIYDGDVETAIYIYMENAVDTYDTEFDLSNRFQRYLSFFPKAKMMYVSLAGKEQAIYKLNEPVDFDLVIEARENTQNMSVRLEVRTADESSIGTSLLFDFVKMKKGDCSTFSMRFDSAGLIPGKYYVVLGLFEKNDMGAYTDIDVVDRAFGFEIIDHENNLHINWLKNYWGNIRMKDIDLIRYKETKSK